MHFKIINPTFGWLPNIYLHIRPKQNETKTIKDRALLCKQGRTKTKTKNKNKNKNQNKVQLEKAKQRK